MVDDIAEKHEKGQPILVGTTSVANSRRSSGSSRQRSTVSAASAVTAPACPWWKRALKSPARTRAGSSSSRAANVTGVRAGRERSGRTPSSRASSALSRSAQPRASLNAQATPRRK
ncbi:hypothetical protein ABT132_51990 [Streptomyces mirabilis]